MTGLSFKQKTIETRCHRTAWIEAGRERGPLMIFLHGWPELGLVWRGQMQHFAGEGWRCVARTLPAAALLAIMGLVSTIDRAAAQGAPPDSSSVAAAGDNTETLRGIERDRRESGQALKTTGNVLLFIPRSLINGFLYATVHCGQLIDDRDVVSSLQELLHSSDRALGWYPVLTAGSGPAIGAAVFYRSPALGVAAAGAYGDTDRWAAKVLASYTFQTGGTVWEVQAAGRIVDRDDYEFYGFGSDPESDPRNQFQQGGAEFLAYTQQLRRFPLTLGMRPSSNWQIFYTFYYQERKLDIPDYTGYGPDPDELPGVEPGVKTTEDQVYNEIAAEYDSRERKKLLSPGVRIEGYGGLAEGTGDYQASFARAGLDASIFVPAIRRNRVIVPRVVFDIIDDRGDGTPISFADYPRHPTFRGVSEVTMLRTDKYAMVPSLEYEWPLTYGLSSGVFVDYLLVSDSLDGLTFSDAPYAVGLDISLHSEVSEVARLTLSSGSEGFHFLFSLGLPQRVSDRKNWQ